MKNRHQLHDPQFLELIEAEAWQRVAAMVPEMHAADIADTLEQLSADDQRKLFSHVPDDVKPDVLAELEHVGSDLLESLSDGELSDIVEEMAPDDAADLLIDLPDERSEEVLALMEEEESAEVRQLMAYGEETAGGIMTPDVVAMRADQTVEEAIAAIAYVEADEPFYLVHIVDENSLLQGYVELWDILRERDRSKRLGEMASSRFAYATVGMDQEEAAYLMSQYDLTVLPVTDDEGHLVGRITADDVIDVIEEEASEDILRLAGSDDTELENTNVWRSCRARLPWLLVTLIGGFLTSLILNRFNAHISEILILGAFVPVVLAMGGNTGIQSSTLVVRGLALGDIQGRSVLKLLGREVATGAVMGCICGLAIGIWARVMLSITPDIPMLFSSLHLVITVSIALFSAMTFAAAFGAMVPMALNRIGVDPAIASGPFISTANDISALLIYFGVTLAFVSVS